MNSLVAVIFAENVQCPSRHRERDSGGAGDWGKESMAHAGSPPTRHRERDSGGAGDWDQESIVSRAMGEGL